MSNTFPPGSSRSLTFSVNIPTQRRDCPLIFDWPDVAGVLIGDVPRAEPVTEESQIETGSRTTLRFIVRRSEDENDDHLTLWRNGDLVGE